MVSRTGASANLRIAAAARGPGAGVRLPGNACFRCAMTALNLEALGPNVRTDVSLELLSRLRDGQVYDEAGRFVLADGRVERQ